MIFVNQNAQLIRGNFDRHFWIRKLHFAICFFNKGGNQLFIYTKAHLLSMGTLCLDTNGSDGVVKLKNCNKSMRSQQWDYDNMVRYRNFCSFLTKINF